ncbi:MAG: sugar phosphate isomerase/epimerase [Clostridia bacterium]|nr:sugar phosphate isomerase/epimerase [Clostridia bacterium]
MKLGAQLFSVRDRCDTPEKLYECIKLMKEIGYDMVQASAICAIEGERLRSFIDELNMPVVCTHRSFDEITQRTDESIKFHKTIGCNVIGIGAMPNNYRGSLEGLKAFARDMSEATKKIKDAGLRFAYHNHAFEFENWDGATPYDYMIENFTDFDYIFDTYWSHYAGADTKKYIRILAESNRLNNMHFKDMISEPQGAICPCGDGIMKFDELAGLCRELGIENIYVEQDNAPDIGDSVAQMKKSYEYLKKIVKE